MKKILISCCISSIFLFAKFGGSVINHQKTIEALSKKQENIKEHLQEIDNFLAKYDRFASSYLSKLKSIVVEGAKCEIAKEKYLYSLEKKGENDKFTIIKKGVYDDCYQMKKNRIKAIKDVKRRVSSLKDKVDDVLELKDIDIEEADRIKQYIDDLRSDVAYYKESKEF
jgi:hypothetical protein